MTDADLERRLGDLAAHLAYPDTPQLAAAVRTRLESARRDRTERPARPSTPWIAPWLRRPMAMAAAVVAIAGLLLAAVQPVRDTVAHWLGINGVTIQPIPTNPTLAPQPSARSTPSSIGERLFLGTPVSLAQARARVDFPLTVPAALGEPDEVLVHATVPGGAAVTLLYLPRAGLPQSSTTGVGMLITELRATVDTRFLQKVVGPDSTIEPVTVGAASGYFISGVPHEITYLDPQGSPFADETRLAGNTLLWQRGDVSLRLEAQLSRDNALAIAASMR